MPKIRPLIDVLKEARKHVSIAQSRVLREWNNPNLSAKMAVLATEIDEILKHLPQESIYDEINLINKEINLINKEAKKEQPIINYKEAIRAIYNTTSGRDALKIGVQYGISNNQLKQIVSLTPAHTNLGKAIAKLKIKPIEPIEPITSSEPIEAPADNITNDSDNNNNGNEEYNSNGELDDELRQKLMGD